MRIGKWTVVVLAVAWIIFTEWRIAFFYHALEKVADQLLLQNDINERIFGR